MIRLSEEEAKKIFGVSGDPEIKPKKKKENDGLNSELHDNLEYSEAKRVYCSNRGKYLGKWDGE